MTTGRLIRLTRPDGGTDYAIEIMDVFNLSMVGTPYPTEAVARAAARTLEITLEDRVLDDLPHILDA